MFSKDIYTKIIYIILITILLYIYKPQIFFKPNGETREYGLGYDNYGYTKTLYTFQFSIFIIAILLSMIS
jgi:hypothetical protein